MLGIDDEKILSAKMASRLQNFILNCGDKILAALAPNILEVQAGDLRVGH